MDVNWQLIAAVVGWIVALLVGLLAVWINNGKDIEATKEAIAKMIGDALALVAAFAKDQAAALTDAQLDGFSGAVYDWWVPRLPEPILSMVRTYYPREAFVILFRRIWREYCGRQAEMAAKAAEAVRMPGSGYMRR
jgi:hypothetical protein